MTLFSGISHVRNKNKKITYDHNSVLCDAKSTLHNLATVNLSLTLHQTAVKIQCILSASVCVLSYYFMFDHYLQTCILWDSLIFKEKWLFLKISFCYLLSCIRWRLGSVKHFFVSLYLKLRNWFKHKKVENILLLLACPKSSLFW
jgi:hypothetical protein